MDSSSSRRSSSTNRRRRHAGTNSNTVEYVQSACKLHLQAQVSSPESLLAVRRFLAASGRSGATEEENDVIVRVGGGEGSGNDNASAVNNEEEEKKKEEEGGCNRLFVWVPRGVVNNTSGSANNDSNNDDNTTEEECYDEAIASTDIPDGRNLGLLAFITVPSNGDSSSSSTPSPSSSSAMTTKTTTTVEQDDNNNTETAVAAPIRSMIQCMVITPRTYLDTYIETNDDSVVEAAAAELTIAEQDSSSNPASTTTYLSLQLYARHCFLPAVRAMEALESKKNYDSSSNESSRMMSKMETLENKLRELDIALGQCQRSSSFMGGGHGIPHIVLLAHPIIIAAAASASTSSTTALDIDNVGLTEYSNNDTILNEVQSSLNVWISQIRKVTSLPGTTPFPTIIDPDTLPSSSSISTVTAASSFQQHGVGSNKEVTFSSSSSTGGGQNNNADLEEVTFWLSLDEALKHIQSELCKPTVLLTIALLRAAKRFVATIALENNTGIANATSHTTDIVNFLRDYPIQMLLSANDCDHICIAVESIFNYYPKIRTSRYYDLDRLARLVEAMTLTLRERIIESMLRSSSSNNNRHNNNNNMGGGKNIILGLDYMQYEKFVRIPTQDIFVLFDTKYTEFAEFFLDQGRMRRRGDETTTPAQVLKGIRLYHVRLRERLDAIYYFRTQHEKLRGVVAEALTGGGGGETIGTSSSNLTSSSVLLGGEDYSTWALKEVDDAPVSLFASLDVLDLSTRGEAMFTNALEGYDRKVDAIEEHLARLLRDKLSSCQVSYIFYLLLCHLSLSLSLIILSQPPFLFVFLSILYIITFLQPPQQDAEDMFRVFARFNPLLSRSRVRTAVKEFQLQLINTVGVAVQKLQSKFMHKYESSSASIIATIRGIPPVSGKILWAKQMERQVHALMKRMSDVLGKEWGQQLEGRQLRRSCDELLSKLDSRTYFRNWVKEWERELSSDTNSKLVTYPIIVVREGKVIVAKANFDEKYEYLSREIRNLKWLGYERDIPRTIALVSEDANARYSHASKFPGAFQLRSSSS